MFDREWMVSVELRTDACVAAHTWLHRVTNLPRTATSRFLRHHVHIIIPPASTTSRQVVRDDTGRYISQREKELLALVRRAPLMTSALP